MKTLEEFVLDSIEEIEPLDEDSAAASTTTGGVAMPDNPTFKKSKAFGHPCIEVDSDTYHACVKGKIPFKRWTKYVEDETLRSELKSMYYKNKRVLIQDNRSGTMAYIK